MYFNSKTLKDFFRVMEQHLINSWFCPHITQRGECSKYLSNQETGTFVVRWTTSEKPFLFCLTRVDQNEIVHRKIFWTEEMLFHLGRPGEKYGHATILKLIDHEKSLGKLVHGYGGDIYIGSEALSQTQVFASMVFTRSLPWTFSDTALQSNRWVIAGSSSVKYSTLQVLKDGVIIEEVPEYENISTLLTTNLFAADYEISDMVLFSNQRLRSAFEYYIDKKSYQMNENSQLFCSKWDTSSTWRRWLQTRLLDYCYQFPNNSKRDRMFIVPVVHGLTSWDVATRSIPATGFETLSQTDKGFFGQGIYNTRHVPYAAKYSCSEDEPIIVISWLCIGIYYCALEFPYMSDERLSAHNFVKREYYASEVPLESKIGSLYGAAIPPPHNSVYTAVRPLNPDDNREMLYIPVEPSKQDSYGDRVYDEFVASSSSQLLPFCALKLKKRQ